MRCTICYVTPMTNAINLQMGSRLYYMARWVWVWDAQANMSFIFIYLLLMRWWHWKRMRDIICAYVTTFAFPALGKFPMIFKWHSDLKTPIQTCCLCVCVCVYRIEKTFSIIFCFVQINIYRKDAKSFSMHPWYAETYSTPNTFWHEVFITILSAIRTLTMDLYETSK